RKLVLAFDRRMTGYAQVDFASTIDIHAGNGSIEVSLANLREVLHDQLNEEIDKLAGIGGMHEAARIFSRISNSLANQIRLDGDRDGTAKRRLLDNGSRRSQPRPVIKDKRGLGIVLNGHIAADESKIGAYLLVTIF